MGRTNFDGRRATNVPLVVEARGERTGILMDAGHSSASATAVEDTFVSDA
jgi:GTP-dependent phosphoenolpyruvate carboxykinase